MLFAVLTTLASPRVSNRPSLSNGTLPLASLGICRMRSALLSHCRLYGMSVVLAARLATSRKFPRGESSLVPRPTCESQFGRHFDLCWESVTYAPKQFLW